MTPIAIEPELRDLLDRWVQAIEAKDIQALSTVFRNGPELAVFWSNGERTIGWNEVRRHIEEDFRRDVELSMDLQDVGILPLGGDTRILTYRYTIRLSLAADSATFRRLATMTVHRDPDGWRVAALHVSNAPAEGGAVG